MTERVRMRMRIRMEELKIRMRMRFAFRKITFQQALQAVISSLDTDPPCPPPKTVQGV